MQEWAYANGRFCAIEEATVSINDRGLLFGDSIYEVIPAYGGVPFQEEAHLARLGRSLREVGIPLDLEKVSVRALIAEGLARCGFPRALIYIQVTRGAAPRSHLPPKDLKPTLIITFRATPQVSPEVYEKGISIMTMPEFRWGRCFIKANTLLPNILTKMEARRLGYYDAIFVTEEGWVREATSANVIAVFGDQLVSPIRDQSILHGTTLLSVTQLAPDLGLTCVERPMHVEELFDRGERAAADGPARGDRQTCADGRAWIHELAKADELMITNASEEIVPVVKVDDHPIGRGVVGPRVRRLHAAFREWTARLADRRASHAA